ncbi:MAG: hypothetical protein ACRC92_20575 [Peptostreptococcaceae bacterium]
MINDDVLKQVTAQNQDQIKSFFGSLGDYFSNRRTIGNRDSGGVDNIGYKDMFISLEHLQLITALPPKFDNIVDPPIEVKDDDYGRTLESFYKIHEGQVAIGRSYLKNVIMNGNFVVLVPLKAKLSQSDVMKITGDRFISSNSPFASVSSMLDSFISRLDIGSYGFTTEIDSKTYHRQVAANMKAALFALGIEIDSGNESEEDNIMKSAMPGWLIENISHNKYRERWGLLSSETGDTAQRDIKDTQMLLEEQKNTINIMKQKRTEYGVNASKYLAESGLSSGIGTIDEQIADLEGKSKMQEEKLANLMASNPYLDNTQTSYSEEFFNKGSLNAISKYVMGAKRDDLQNFPFVTFYVNGPIEKSYSGSQEVSESVLGSVFGNAGQAVKDKLLNSAAGGKLGGMISGNDGVVKEIAYLTGSNMGTGLFLDMYIPKTNKSVSSDMQYSIPIRAIADGSDPISILTVPIWTLAQLYPFVLEPLDNRFKSTFIPKSPMLCSAFSKGLFNIPKGVVSSIDIKTDPVFQTTESVCTDIEINITLTPFIGKGFSPDFSTVFNKNEDGNHLLMSIYNPFSSFNILVTMCGLNTTMTTIQKSLFEHLVLDKVLAIGTIGPEAWQSFKTFLVDKKSTTLRNIQNFKTK